MSQRHAALPHARSALAALGTTVQAQASENQAKIPYRVSAPSRGNCPRLQHWKTACAGWTWQLPGQAKESFRAFPTNVGVELEATGVCSLSHKVHREGRTLRAMWRLFYIACLAIQPAARLENPTPRTALSLSNPALPTRSVWFRRVSAKCRCAAPPSSVHHGHSERAHRRPAHTVHPPKNISISPRLRRSCEKHACASWVQQHQFPHTANFPVGQLLK